MKKKAVVFGGSGFLGSHVADALTDSGYDVVVFDKVKSAHINSGQRMIVGDILDEGKVMDALKGASFVYNFASIADIEESSNRPLDTIRFNIIGHSVILNACAERKVKRVVFASSMYVYSHLGSFYRAAKQSCELLTEAYHEKYGLNYTIIRYGSLYGPRSQRWNGIYGYLNQAISKGRIDYNGTGEEIREYIHVRDAARLSVDILKPAFENQSVIITGTQTLTSRQLLNMISEMLGNKIKVNYLNKGSGDHYSISPYVFSPKVARKLVSNLFVDLGQGLLEMAQEMHIPLHRHSKTVSTRSKRRSR